MKMNAVSYSHLNSRAVFSKFSVEAPAQAGGNTILRDVRIVEEGEAQGHGVFLDSDFVADTVALAAGRRIKCRFGHPQMCGDSLGKLLGYYDNFRLMSDDNGAYAVADLHLLKVADLSPDGKLAEYISELSQVADDMFGNSIVFSALENFYKTEKGVKLYPTWDNDTHDYKTKEGVGYDSEEHGKIDESKLYVSIAQLHESDLVDSPAATRSLFGTPTVLNQLLNFFGLNINGMRKTVLLKQLVQSYQKMEKFNINAKTSEGVDIVVVTENDYIGIGDSVQLPDGTPAPDGEHIITESDSGQSNTITVAAGVITNIAATVAAETTAEEGPVDTQASADLSAVQAELSTAKNEIEKLTKQLSAAQAQIKVLSAKPIAAPITPVPSADAKAKTKYVSPLFKK
jgi:hypothetical protein